MLHEKLKANFKGKLILTFMKGKKSTLSWLKYKTFICTSIGTHCDNGIIHVWTVNQYLCKNITVWKIGIAKYAISQDLSKTFREINFSNTGYLQINDKQQGIYRIYNLESVTVTFTKFLSKGNFYTVILFFPT